MNQSNVRNMVILKNLPSNIVEEAIVILKTNKKIKKLEKVEKNKIVEDKIYKKKEMDYILKEAEMLVSNYISSLEEKKEEKKVNSKKLKKRYDRMRNYAYTVTLIIFIETIILFA